MSCASENTHRRNKIWRKCCSSRESVSSGQKFKHDYYLSNADSDVPLRNMPAWARPSIGWKIASVVPRASGSGRRPGAGLDSLATS